MSSLTPNNRLETDIWCGLSGFRVRNSPTDTLPETSLDEIVSNSRSALTGKLDRIPSVAADRAAQFGGGLLVCVAYRPCDDIKNNYRRQYLAKHRSVMAKAINGKDGLDSLGMVMTDSGAAKYSELDYRVRPQLPDMIKIDLVAPNRLSAEPTSLTGQQEAQIFQFSARP